MLAQFSVYCVFQRDYPDFCLLFNFLFQTQSRECCLYLGHQRHSPSLSSWGIVEVVAENLSAAWKTEQHKTLQTSICRVLTLPEVLTPHGHTWGRS